MAAVFKSAERNFRENPDRIDHFRLVSDYSIIDRNLKTENLHFDLRRLDPDQYSSLYHSHRYAEELFLILSGSALLRTPEGIQMVETGDLIFFERGDTGPISCITTPSSRVFTWISERSSVMMCVIIPIRTAYCSYRPWNGFVRRPQRICSTGKRT